jgi:transposase
LQKLDSHIIETADSDYLKEIVFFLLEKVEQLSVENAELQRRLNQNSQNSSRPPSSDGYRKVAKITKTESIKVQGGQIGHKGNTRHQVDIPDAIVSCCPNKCSCGHEFTTHSEMVLQSKRQVFDIPQPQLFVTEYQILGSQCPKCGKISQGEAPIHVNSAVQYGNMVKAFVVLLNNEYKMPIHKIGELFKILYGYNINESTIVSILRNCYDKLSDTENIIKKKIKSSKIGHVDETGIRIEKKLNWLHVFSTQYFTHLFVHPKRGKEAIESEQSIIPNFRNWLMHDCWATYFNFTNAKQGG